MREFNVLATALKAGETETLRPIEGPSIVIATEGAGKLLAGSDEYDIKRGWVYFFGPGVGPKYAADAEGLQLYTAYAE